MPWREISSEQLNSLRRVTIVDVRSPIEHEAEAIPGSFNVPLLSNLERAQVGTTYKEKGEIVARRQALCLIAPKAPALIESIAALQETHGSTLVIYCWRGGLRSESVASLLSIAGISCARLTGGYKAWRRQLLSDLENYAVAVEPVILHGTTGCGKTEILRILEASGHQVLDLEGLASHRGSVFGGMGLTAQPSQKDFEARVWQKLRAYEAKPLFIEAESRKVGRLTLPDLVYKDLIRKGTNILVTGAIKKRAERIVEDYLSTNSGDLLVESLKLLGQLKVRLGQKKLDELEKLLEDARTQEAVSMLLSDYYDPLYRTQIRMAAPFALEVSGDDPTQAAKLIQEWAGRPVHQNSKSNEPITG